MTSDQMLMEGQGPRTRREWSHQAEIGGIMNGDQVLTKKQALKNLGKALADLDQVTTSGVLGTGAAWTKRQVRKLYAKVRGRAVRDE